MESSSNPRFSIFDGFLEHHDLLLYFTTQHLEPRELFILYQISKPFHAKVNSSLTSYILSAARRWARLTATRPGPDIDRKFPMEIPGVGENPSINLSSFRSRCTASTRILMANGTEPTPPGVYSQHDITTLLPYRCYAHFCVLDPDRRDFSAEERQRKRNRKQKPMTWITMDPSDAEASIQNEANEDSWSEPKEVIRDVPTFRYLGFLLHRSRIVNLIIHHLAQYGHRLPAEETPAILAKLSLTLDIPNNARRLALFRNRKYWTNRDLYFAQLFFIKLDMCFSDPVDGTGETGLRKLLLSQPGLEMLEATLARRQCNTFLEMIKLYVRTFHLPAREHRHLPIFDIPAEEVGKTCLEGWGRPPWDYDPVLAYMAQHLVSERKAAVRHAYASRSESPSAQRHRLITQYLPIITPPRRRLLRPEELIVGESFRRNFPLHNHYTRMMCWGYLDPKTGEDLPDPAEESDIWTQEQLGGRSDDEDSEINSSRYLDDASSHSSDEYSDSGDEYSDTDEADNDTEEEEEEDGNETEEDDSGAGGGSAIRDSNIRRKRRWDEMASSEAGPDEEEVEEEDNDDGEHNEGENVASEGDPMATSSA